MTFWLWPGLSEDHYFSLLITCACGELVFCPQMWIHNIAIALSDFMTCRLSCEYGFTTPLGKAICSTIACLASVLQHFPSHVPHHNVLRRLRSSMTSARDTPCPSLYPGAAGHCRILANAASPVWKLSSLDSWQLTSRHRCYSLPAINHSMRLQPAII